LANERVTPGADNSELLVEEFPTPQEWSLGDVEERARRRRSLDKGASSF
jgi:hypothetical protein